MSNQSQINCSCLTPILDTTPSLDQLLDSLGFDLWMTITSTFVIPTLSLIGVIFCSLSAWIFFQRNFKDPVFFYYRLLCFVYIIHLLHNIPSGLLFSPRYFPRINTYWSSIYLIYYTCMSVLLFHFEETLQIAILLTRMKIFSPFVNRHFTTKPWVVSLSLFITCLLINTPLAAIGFKIESFGTFYYFDSSNSSQQNALFFFFTSSDFSLTLIGQIILPFTFAFLNIFLSALVGIILNSVSVYLYRYYVKERRWKNEAYTRTACHHPSPRQENNLASTSSDQEIQVVVIAQSRNLTQKEINENKTEKNMFYMALTLCSVSVFSKLILIFTFVFFFFFNSFSNNLILLIITQFLYTFLPTSGIFVFYSFNKMFREEFVKKFFSKENLNSTSTNRNNQLVARQWIKKFFCTKKTFILLFYNVYVKRLTY